jgi:hypothetical protein
VFSDCCIASPYLLTPHCTAQVIRACHESGLAIAPEYKIADGMLSADLVMLPCLPSHVLAVLHERLADAAASVISERGAELEAAFHRAWASYVSVADPATGTQTAFECAVNDGEVGGALLSVEKWDTRTDPDFRIYSAHAESAKLAWHVENGPGMLGISETNLLQLDLSSGAADELHRAVAVAAHDVYAEVMASWAQHVTAKRAGGPQPAEAVVGSVRPADGGKPECDAVWAMGHLDRGLPGSWNSTQDSSSSSKPPTPTSPGLTQATVQARCASSPKPAAGAEAVAARGRGWPGAFQRGLQLSQKEGQLLASTQREEWVTITPLDAICLKSWAMLADGASGHGAAGVSPEARFMARCALQHGAVLWEDAERVMEATGARGLQPAHQPPLHTLGLQRRARVTQSFCSHQAQLPISQLAPVALSVQVYAWLWRSTARCTTP